MECYDSIGDINGDQQTSILDIMIVINCILSDSCDACSDFNNDGITNIIDIIELINLIIN